MFVREILWSKILHVSDFYYKPYFIIYMLFCVISIFIVCGLIAYVKNITIGKLLNRIRLFDKIFEKLDNIINSEE